MIKNKLLILPLILLICGCANKTPTSNIKSDDSLISESNSSESEFGELIIDDVDFLYYELGPQKLNINFTNKQYEEAIEYRFQSTYIKIENGYVIPLKKGQTVTYVTATTSHHETQFKITMPNINNERYNRAVSYANAIKSKINNNTTVFLGDSFFDVDHFWKNFYTDVGGNAYICGISSSTIEEWILYSSMILKDLSPKFLVFHIGTNDFWDLKRSCTTAKKSFKFMMDNLHRICPDTKIIICSVENRANKMPQTNDMNATIAFLKEYDAFVQEYVIANKSYMGYINSIAHFCNEDWTLKTDLTKDGIHPKNTEYSFYIDEVIKFGADITNNMAS